MRFGSLFSGIGGIDLGLERAGMSCQWQVEIEDYPRRVLAKHWPDVPRFEDVRDVGKQNLAPVDLIAGGFPCQPFSHAGKQKGEHDARHLWPQFLRIIRELRPRWVLAENVPAMLTVSGGRVFGGILRDLAEVGYDATWQDVPAFAVGAPHKRSRIFVVCHANGQGEPAKPEHVAEAPGVPKHLADADEPGLQRRLGEVVPERTGELFTWSGSALARFREQRTEWEIESSVGRVVNGLPRRMDRLKGLGNAVVPQVAEFVGRRIMETENGG